MIVPERIYDENLPHRAVSVYCYLCGRANKKGECFPAVRRISGELNLSKSTVYRAFSELEEYGLLERKARYHTQGGQRSSLYKIKGEIGVKENV